DADAATARVLRPRRNLRRLRGEEGANGADRVGVGGLFVGAVGAYAREPESDAARVAGRHLHAVERDLDDKLGTHVHGVVVTSRRDGLQLFRLPGEELIGETLER